MSEIPPPEGPRPIGSFVGDAGLVAARCWRCKRADALFLVVHDHGKTNEEAMATREPFCDRCVMELMHRYKEETS
jgi:hypothetical protein